MKKNITIIFIAIFVSITYAQYIPDWLEIYDVGTTGGEVGINLIASDQDGNVYVCGFKDQGLATNEDIILIKYSPDGNLLWSKWYNSPYNLDERPYGLVISSSGEPIIAGYSDSPKGSDGLILKYDHNGFLLWDRRVESTADTNDVTNDYIKAVTLDNFNNIYVTGSYKEPYKTQYCLASKYNLSGDQIWLNKYVYDYPYSGNSGFSICYDDINQSCYVFATGTIGLDTSWTSDTTFVLGGIAGFSLLKFGTVGNLIWVDSLMVSDEWMMSELSGITDKCLTDNAGNIYLGTRTRDIEAGNSYEDFLLFKVAPNGNTLWTRLYEQTIYSKSKIADLKVDELQNVYVIGPSSDYYSGGQTNWVTIKYNADGEIIWTKIYDRHGYDDTPVGLFFDKVGNILVGGSAKYQGFTGSDYALVRYTSDGVMIDTCIYHAPSQEYCKAMTVDNLDNVLFTGTWGSGFYFGTMRLIPDSVTSVDDDLINPEGFSLSQNYPNPFNPTTKIKYTITTSPKSSPKERTFVRLIVYDILGNEIATLVNEEKPQGEYEVEFNASDYNLSSGIYFYQLRAAGFSSTKKFVLMK
ncbi:MAG: hypothetical protein STSR0008_00010 [Ignavibacterium sp.]